MADINWCVTPYGCDPHILPSGSTIYTGTISLTRETSSPHISRSQAISGLVLEDGKRYAFFISEPHHVFTATCSVSGGNVVVGPIRIGGLLLTITCNGSSSIIEVENGVMVGHQYAYAPDEITLQVDWISGGGGTADNPVIDVEIGANDEIVVTFADGTTSDIGTVGSSDVFVPHIDEHHILTWTIEDEPGDIPDPTDLNPWDEWSPVPEPDNNSQYDWNGI